MWSLPRSGIRPMSPALAGRNFTPEPPGKPCHHSCPFSESMPLGSQEMQSCPLSGHQSSESLTAPFKVAEHTVDSLLASRSWIPSAQSYSPSSPVTASTSANTLLHPPPQWKPNIIPFNESDLQKPKMQQAVLWWHLLFICNPKAPEPSEPLNPKPSEKNINAWLHYGNKIKTL